METDIVHAFAWLFQNVEPGVYHLVAEPVKMLAEDCIKAALAINMDDSHPLIMTCVPFIENATEVVQ